MRWASVSCSCFERAQVVEDGHALGENGAAGERKAVLRQVADGDALLRR